MFNLVLILPIYETVKLPLQPPFTQMYVPSKPNVSSLIHSLLFGTTRITVPFALQRFSPASGHCIICSLIKPSDNSIRSENLEYYGITKFFRYALSIWHTFVNAFPSYSKNWRSRINAEGSFTTSSVELRLKNSSLVTTRFSVPLTDFDWIKFDESRFKDQFKTWLRINAYY